MIYFIFINLKLILIEKAAFKVNLNKEVQIFYTFVETEKDFKFSLCTHKKVLSDSFPSQPYSGRNNRMSLMFFMISFSLFFFREILVILTFLKFIIILLLYFWIKDSLVKRNKNMTNSYSSQYFSFVCKIKILPKELSIKKNEIC